MERFRARVLVVDDEEGNLLAMQRILEAEAFHVVCAKQPGLALSMFKKNNFDLVLSDLRMPGLNGLELLRAIRKINDRIPVLILTAFGTVDDAVEAMKLGAVDFLSKPIKKDVLLKVVQDLLSKKSLDGDSSDVDFIGDSSSISEIKKSIRILSKTSASVLIEGESGVGKEVVAKAIHRESGRKGPLVSINCSAIPEQLLESELFGYEKGAFTGAIHAKEGLFSAANHGTLFLDEIGDMSLNLQAKMLRVLQEGVFHKIGSTTPTKVDVRIVAATNASLKNKILRGEFREDLYYRLNVVAIVVPPLRDRQSDIGLLSEYFLTMACKKFNKDRMTLTSAAKDTLRSYTWPGNVRELRNIIERAVVLSETKEITSDSLNITNLSNKEKAQESRPAEEIVFPIGTSLKEIELLMIKKTLEYTNGDKQKAADLLGINQRTIYRKIPELGE
ncbi:MAG: sigma-54 dependent transcriptional regulator [Oligoflexia bacterium]|nr:sigma-54 dependent transcriptional regulator [Oligoflexia bacterium]